MKYTTVFKDTSFGLHPGHRQIYALLRNYEKTIQNFVYYPRKEMVFPYRNIMTLVKNCSHIKNCTSNNKNVLNNGFNKEGRQF